MSAWIGILAAVGAVLSGAAGGWVTFGKPAARRAERRNKRRHNEREFVRAGGERVTTLEQDMASVKNHCGELSLGQAVISHDLKTLNDKLDKFVKEQTPNGKNTRNVGDLIALIADAVVPKDKMSSLPDSSHSD